MKERVTASVLLNGKAFSVCHYDHLLERMERALQVWLEGDIQKGLSVCGVNVCGRRQCV
jgi:hypothetical protein